MAETTKSDGMSSFSEIERVYMDLLVDIGRAGKGKNIYLVWANQKQKLLTIKAGDYREEMIESSAYELIGTYSGKNGYPRFSEIYGDIHAFIQEETSKEYGYRPELQKLAEAG